MLIGAVSRRSREKGKDELKKGFIAEGLKAPATEGSLPEALHERRYTEKAAVPEVVSPSFFSNSSTSSRDRVS